MPKISVIVPNYNHALYLHQRLQTIVLQTFQDYELILLDDASTDGSVAILNKFAAATSAKTFYNQTNSGNPFLQWNHGAKMASGDYLWIAESDDFAHPSFLSKMVSLLDCNPSVGLVYCQSIWVNEHNELLGEAPRYYRNLPNSNRWRQSYLNNGQSEIKTYLARLCTIPNASAVLIRRNAFDQVGGADETFRLAGDWITWLKILTKWDVAYVAQPLNYFRQHRSTVRATADMSGLYIKEYYRIQQLLPYWIQIPIKTRHRAFNYISYNWFRAGIMGTLPLETNRPLFEFARLVDSNLSWRMLKYIVKYPGRIVIYKEKPDLTFLAQLFSLVTFNLADSFGKQPSDDQQ